MLELVHSEVNVKKLFLLTIIIFTITSCKIVKLEDLQKDCSKNKTLILFFSQKIEKPIIVKIDGKPVPIISVFSGELLEIYKVPEGKHYLEISSKYYIFNKPIRELDVKYNDNCAQQVIVRNYIDKLVEDTGENSFVSKIKRKILFWKKTKGQDKNSINNKTIYGQFTD